MKVRLLADADLNKAIISGVLRREPAMDFQTADGRGIRRRMVDLEVLAIAAAQDRVLFSHDVGTMSAHFRTFRNTVRTSPRLILIPQQLPIADAMAELLLVWHASERLELENRILWLPL